MIRLMAWVAMKPGKLSAFKDVASDLITVTKEKDPGVSVYHFYENERTQTVVIHESYADEAVFLTHIGNISHLVGRLTDAAIIERVVVCGAVTPRAAKILTGFTGESDVENPVRCTFFRDMASI